MTRFEREVLSAAIDDASGLWEALEIAKNVFPTRKDVDRFKIGRQTLKAMMEEGLVYLCFFKATTNQEIRIPNDENREILDDDADWQPAFPNVWHVRFVATEKGKQTYLALSSPA